MDELRATHSKETSVFEKLLMKGLSMEGAKTAGRFVSGFVI